MSTNARPEFRWFDHLDFHVVWLFVCLLFLLVFPVPLLNAAIVLLAPQGRILFHALLDLRAHGQPWVAYLVANEVLTIGAAAGMMTLTDRIHG